MNEIAIKSKIYTIRKNQVMLDRDLVELCVSMLSAVLKSKIVIKIDEGFFTSKYKDVTKCVIIIGIMEGI